MASAKLRFACLFALAVVSLPTRASPDYNNRASQCPPQGCQQLEKVTITGTRIYQDTLEGDSYFHWIFFGFDNRIVLPDTYDVTLAKLENSFDVRCLASGSSGDLQNVKSTDDAAARRQAAQLAYDRMGQRVQEGPFGSAWRSLFGNLRRITVTYADGGTEQYDVQGVLGSVTLNPVEGSLKEGSGTVEPVDPSKCSAQA